MLSNDGRPPRVPRSALADTLLERLTQAYAPAADPARAAAMTAYMRHVAPFLGIPAPLRRELSKTVTKNTPRPTQADVAALALRCWRLPEREYHYFAVDYLRRHVGTCSAGFLPVVRQLITTVPWWDTVDLLAAHTVGPLVAADRGLAPVMDEWIGSEDLWLARTALLHQLRYKDATDTGRLFAYCRRRAGHPDFFLRKAIGWALREYAKTDPEAVRAFVDAERAALSPLSVREALKNC
ncbi:MULTISPECIES: DNA alkylation repair protein [Streptomyces]|uniref:DNA alkylation repair protein n=1 Tax=Streptomyces amritsarensis TaxID=681158 RepID=A0ABX3G6C8_9ACTN|nr:MULTISPECIES: DNA alkylation repair protein [Streptomyces]AQT71422.1 DNA alkylation repair protein [Streptomyces sp. fd1-xmd]MDX6762557.1 DNA alkylation repair protein [Streptomyces sp. F8]OLZ70093.1 DNA alkylation repair protein [Streptomyces amritsarensis]